MRWSKSLSMWSFCIFSVGNLWSIFYSEHYSVSAFTQFLVTSFQVWSSWEKSSLLSKQRVESIVRPFKISFHVVFSKSIMLIFCSRRRFFKWPRCPRRRQIETWTYVIINLWQIFQATIKNSHLKRLVLWQSCSPRVLIFCFSSFPREERSICHDKIQWVAMFPGYSTLIS